MTGAPERRHSDTLLYGAIGVMVLFWSLNYIVGKFALRDFPAALLAGLRVTLAAVIILPVYAWRRLRPVALASSEPRPGAGLFILLGLAGVALNQLFFTAGLNRTSVAHTSILIGITPVLVLLIAAARRLEKLTAVKIAGMAIALGGVAVLNASPAKGAHATLAGDVLVFMGAFCFAVFTVAGKRATCCYDSITVTAAAYLCGAAFLAPVTVWQSLRFDYSAVTAAGWAGLVYMAALPSVLCYLIYYWALIYIPASRVSSFSYLQPLIATLLAVPLLGESITQWVALGGMLVLGGVFVTERFG